MSRLVIKPVVLGKRIELIRTDNPYADLKPGDRGTVVDVSELSYEDKPLKYILDPQYVDIKARIDGRKSSFSVPGIIDVQVENFMNPVTGEEQDTKVQLPKGFIFKIADAAKTKVMKILTPSLNFYDSGKNAYYSVVEYGGP